MTRKPDRACGNCGRGMWRKAGDPDPKLCRGCRAEVRGPRYVRTTTPDEHMALLRAGRLAIRDRVCECGAEFQGTAGRRFCDTCRSIRRGDHYRAKGARRREVASATGERITIAALGDRDAWTCWICSQFVNRDLSGRDPRMPSFDHVLPISRGGLDSWDNLRLAHLVCNVKRGNRDMVQSLVQTQ